jgi:hypothetical protein
MGEQDHDGNHEQRRRDVPGVLEGVEDMLVARTEGVPRARQCGAPDGTADDGVEQELGEGHLAEAGRKGDE